MTDPVQRLARLSRPSMADRVHEDLYRQIVTQVLPPGTRLSEGDVARALDVSRQPVRDAFHRLAKLGFLTIRPQSATRVALISVASVHQARFLRTAIEVETVRVACATLTEADLAALGAILDEQARHLAPEAAEAFHLLDDRFHEEICRRAGHGPAWETIRAAKAQMDRVRFLSLSFASGPAHQDHRQILAAIRNRAPKAAAKAMRAHLARILDQIVQIRATHGDFFAPDEAE